MKQAKLLLTWQGEPLICQAAKVALNCLSPVVFITGAWEKEVRDAVDDLPLKIVHNH